jgi:hypothetical protein
VPQATGDGLHTKVSSLAQAIGSFADTAGQAESSPSLLTTTAGDAGGNTPVTLAVVGMVDVMKQFDASGNLIGASTTTNATATQALAGASLLNPSTNDFLALGGKT